MQIDFDMDYSILFSMIKDTRIKILILEKCSLIEFATKKHDIKLKNLSLTSLRWNSSCSLEILNFNMANVQVLSTNKMLRFPESN